MPGQDLHVFTSKSGGTSGLTRPSKLPLFTRRSTEKHLPSFLQPSISSSTTTSSLSRVRPSTIVKPFFAAHHHPANKSDVQRRCYPASQPSTPVRGGQPENMREFQQLHRSAHFLRSGVTPGSTALKRSENPCAIPQSTSFSGSRCVAENPSWKSSKSDRYRMENMSVEHLQYLERRLQQILEVMPTRPALSVKAKSDSARQVTCPSWMGGTHHQHQPLHYPVVATPFHYHPETAPLLLFPPQPSQLASQSPSTSQLPPPHPVFSGRGFGELDPYCLSSVSSTSSCYAGTIPSALQDFNREELYCLLHAVRNMLSMHQQNQQPSTSKSSTGINPLSALQHRPFSWYLHRNATATAPSSPSSSTVNLFLDDDDSVNAETADDGEIVGMDMGEEDEEDELNRKASSTEGGPHPPLLPAGFRNFSRYLDSKFGPDSSEEPRNRHHHHQQQQRRHRRDPVDNNASPVVVTTSSSVGGGRGRNAVDVRPKISITTCSGDTGTYPDSALPPQESSRQVTDATTTGVDENELAQRLAPTWCAPYWCPPPPPTAAQPVGWYQQVAAPPAQPPPPPPPIPPLPPQLRYFAPPPPPNAAAACWFRAAANHFATAAAIFAADNAAAASAMATPHQLPPPIPTTAVLANRTWAHRGPVAPSPSMGHPQNPPVSSSVSPIQAYPPAQRTAVAKAAQHHDNGKEEEDEFFAVSDEKDQQICRRRRQSHLPAVEPLQRQLWGRCGDDLDSPRSQAADDDEYGLDMLPQDPALILPDQVDFYTQIRDLLELDSNISLPLPAGWAVGVSSSGRRFYVSCATGETSGSGGGDVGGSAETSGPTCPRSRTRTTTWQHPIIAPRIPLGWERVEMRRGNCVYYRHLLIPHTQRHHPDLWFPTSLKNVELEQEGWFFDLRKLQESVPNFDKGNSQIIESYADTRDPSEEVRFIDRLKRYALGELETLLKHLDCRFFRDLHRMVVAFEVARIRIVRELFIQHVHRTTVTAASSPSRVDRSAEN